MGFFDEHCLFQELTDEEIAAGKPFYYGNDDLARKTSGATRSIQHNSMWKNVVCKSGGRERKGSNDTILRQFWRFFRKRKIKTVKKDTRVN